MRTDHRLRRVAPALILALLATAAPLRAQATAEAPAPSRHRAAIEEARAALASLMAEHAIPGLSAAVAVDGEIAWSEGMGYADLEHRVSVTRLTRFRIGSVSKPVTAAALGRLYEEGRLELDAPVQRYVPDFPRKRWPVTARQLAGHLAGVRHYRGDEFLSARRYATVAEGLEIFREDTLLHRPGTAYRYSSYGWNLLSAVIEGAAGESFLAYVRRAVFEPLGLRSIVAEHTDSIIAHRASFYTRSDENGRILNAPYVDNSYKWAGGGYIANAEDLARFGAAHLTGELLRAETVELLFTSQRTEAGEATGYGLGWSSGVDERGRRWVGHTGGSVGGRAVLLLFPEERVVVAVLANLGSAPMRFQLARRLGGFFIAERQARR